RKHAGRQDGQAPVQPHLSLPDLSPSIRCHAYSNDDKAPAPDWSLTCQSASVRHAEGGVTDARHPPGLDTGWWEGLARRHRRSANRILAATAQDLLDLGPVSAWFFVVLLPERSFGAGARRLASARKRKKFEARSRLEHYER